MRERRREETAIRPENNSDNRAVVFPSGSSGKIGKERPDVKDTIEIPALFINRDLGCKIDPDPVTGISHREMTQNLEALLGEDIPGQP